MRSAVGMGCRWQARSVLGVFARNYTGLPHPQAGVAGAGEVVQLCTRLVSLPIVPRVINSAHYVAAGPDQQTADARHELGRCAALPSSAVAPLPTWQASTGTSGPLAPWRPPMVDIAALAAAPDGAERLAAAIAAAPEGVLLLSNALPAPFGAIGKLFDRVTPQAGARANAGALRQAAAEGKVPVQLVRCVPLPPLGANVQCATCSGCFLPNKSHHSAPVAAYQAGTSRLVWKDAHGEGRWGSVHMQLSSLLSSLS